MGDIYGNEDGSDEHYPQQDSEGMIIGVGNGNSNITKNFKAKSNNQTPDNMLKGLKGDRSYDDENLNMDEDN